jgi:hypothetical protein
MANNLAAFNAQLWSKSLIANLNQVNVMLPKTNRQWEGQLNGIGDTVQVRTLGSVTMSAYTKNSTSISYQDLTPVKEPLTVADAQYFAFEVDDVDAIQNDIDALDSYTMRAAVSMNNTIEAKILAAYTGALAANKITGASSANITLDSTNSATGIYNNLVKARENLSAQNVPLAGRWVVVDPKTVTLLLNDTAHFIRSTSLGDGVVGNGTIDGHVQTVPGYVGKCAGFDVFESNAVPIVSSSKYLVYGDNMAIAYVSQLKELEVIRLQSSFTTAVRGMLLHDTAVFAESSKRLGYIKATP